MILSDAYERELFEGSIHQNFSVIAPAGVGKTTAITRRIAYMVVEDMRLYPTEQSQIKKLVAVTYTEKAAREIKERSYEVLQKIIEEEGGDLRSAFARLNEAFFGTIHAFAMKLIKGFIGYASLKENFEIVTDKEALFSSFLQKINGGYDVVPEGRLNEAMAAVALEEVLKQAKETKPNEKLGPFPSMPLVDVKSVLDYIPRASETSVFKYQRRVLQWQQFWAKGQPFEFPDVRKICFGKTFIEYVEATIGGFLSWKEEVKRWWVNAIAHAFQSFREEEGLLLYDDLIRIALELLQIPEVRTKIAAEPFYVILDEAQDTDKQQFALLSRIASREGELIPGHFSMVGDPQQSIYLGRAHVEYYQHLHQKWVDSGEVVALTFSVTMRCPPQVVETVNHVFSQALTSVHFVPLTAFQESFMGNVEVITTGTEGIKEDPVAEECRQIAQFFSGKMPTSFGVERWSQVALLSPRKEWLSELAQWFSPQYHTPAVQLHFEDEFNHRPKLLLWVASCLRYIICELDRRELAGILREIFGCPSREILDYIKYGKGERCQEIEAMFSMLRSCYPQTSLGRFLRKVESTFQLYERMRALNILSKQELEMEWSCALECFYFAESQRWDLFTTENYLIERSKVSLDVVQEDSIQLLSFHKSKGLEWEVVMLPFLFRLRQIPVSALSQVTSEQYLQNEVRMLYVAYTRSKKQLLLVNDAALFPKNNRKGTFSSHELLKNLK